MARSVWKGKNTRLLNKGNDGAYFWNRGDKIEQEHVGLVYNVYNGNSFVELYIEESMVGKKFGEYVPTRRMSNAIHNKKEKGKKR